MNGQHNIYELNKEQYEQFKELEDKNSHTLHDWFIETLDPENIYLLEEFISEIAYLDNYIFDYFQQKEIIN